MKSRVSIAALPVILGLAQAPLGAHTLLSDVVLAPPEGPFASHEAHFQPIIRPGEVAAGFEVNQLEVPLAINSIIRDELQEHRRLHQQGALAAKHFEAAKASILRHHR